VSGWSDALRSLPPLLAATAGVAAERVRRAAGGEVSWRASRIDAAALESLVRERHPDARIASVERAGGHAGTTSRVRLRVRWAREPRGIARVPRQVFVKLAPEDWPTRIFVDLMRLGANEVGFYRRLRDQAPVEAPLALAAVRARRGRAFALVLEDLEEDGCRFGEGAARLGFEEAARAVRSLAALHAAFWSSPVLARERGWLKHPSRNPLAAVERLLGTLALAPALRRHGDRFPESIRSQAPAIVAARSDLDRAWSEGPHTLLHGDPHLGNLYFRGDRVGFLDWQVVQAGQGMRDVTYLLLNAADADVLERRERELIELYREALHERGVEAPTSDCAFDQYRLHAFYVFIGVVVTAASPTLQPPEVVEAAIDSVCAALARLDALQALRALAR